MEPLLHPCARSTRPVWLQSTFGWDAHLFQEFQAFFQHDRPPGRAPQFHPELSSSPREQPGLFQPGLFQPGLFQPGLFQPGLFQHGLFQHGLFQHGLFQHDLFQHDLFQHDPAQ
jgi:hypothetical protein